jgi:tRNA pseudouridine38-40 synthase
VLLNTTINLIAGRTDTGVHAKEMYAHFDFETPIDVARLVHKLNSLQKKDIVVLTLFQFMTKHTCFDATKRTYEYQHFLRMLSDRNTVGISINH